jgi:heat shock protein HslJ
MIRRTLLGSFLVLSLVLAACGGSSATPAPIGGTSWAMTGFSGLMGAGMQDLPAGGVTISFGTDGSVEGKGACNSFNSTFTTDGNKLKIAAPLASTKMACGGSLDAWENAYFSFLTSSPDYSVNAGTLELSGASTKVTYASS